jgi:hypothetical protein
MATPRSQYGRASPHYSMLVLPTHQKGRWFQKNVNLDIRAERYRKAKLRSSRDGRI